MSESNIHKNLVIYLKKWVIDKKGSDGSYQLFIDIDENKSYEPPPIIGNYKPDLLLFGIIKVLHYNYIYLFIFLCHAILNII